MSPREFKPGDRVRVAPALGSLPYDGRVIGEPTSGGIYPVSGRGPDDRAKLLRPERLTLIEPASDPTPVEPTDEQRAAVEWLRAITIDAYARQEVTFAQELLAALPDSLTNAVPARPTEPGHYEDENGRHWLHQVYDGKGDHPDVDQWLNSGGHIDTPPAVLYRLVRERRPVTRLQIVQAAGNLQDWQTEALLKLANGTPDE